MVLPSEPEFEQALNELATSLAPFLKANPEYQKALEIVQIPERIVQFRVVWEDDQGKPQVNRGYRVQVSVYPSQTLAYMSLSHSITVQLCSRSLQGRTSSPSLCQVRVCFYDDRQVNR